MKVEFLFDAININSEVELKSKFKQSGVSF